MDPKGLDGQVVRPSDAEFKTLRDQFVVVRVLGMHDIDIEKFQFDYDLVFAVIFMNANGNIYSRYGSRTRWNHDSRMSLDGLKHTMKRVIQIHDPKTTPKIRPTKSRTAASLFSGNRGCMHCHEVFEGLRQESRRNGTFRPESLFVYPLPENLGITLDVTQGSKVVELRKNSRAAQARMRPNDILLQIDDTRILSQADVGWALHNAPSEGRLTIKYQRDAAIRYAVFQLPRGWKKTNLSWRASMRHEFEE